jgi:hypothetical protein
MQLDRLRQRRILPRRWLLGVTMRAYWAGLFVLVAALAGCRADSRFVVFTSDILAVAAGGAAAPVSALYRVEISSMSDCEEKKSAVMAIVARYFEVTSAALCDGGEDNSWLEYSAKTELVALGAALPGNAPLGLAAAQTGSGVALHLLFDARRFAALGHDVEAMDLGASVEIGGLTLEILHDGDAPLVLAAPSAWLNNAPRVAPALTLTRRDSAVLRLSDVAGAALQADGTVLALTLALAP